jgi:hypothetical protein
VNVGDPRADPAEVAIMRRDGDKCILILPMVHRGQAIGLLEVLDHVRERRFTRQEMRLATAIAGQAAVAMHNAHVFAQLRRSDQDVLDLRRAIEAIAGAHRDLTEQTSEVGLLQAAAGLAAHALKGLSCVANWGDQSAGASGVQPDGDDHVTAPRGASAPRATQAKPAHVLVASAPCRDRQLTLTLTLSGAGGEGRGELLGLIATVAAGALDCLLTRSAANAS